MAWGYWTTYSTYATRQTGRENQRALSPPAKRERSLERESRERERQAGGGGQAESGSRTPGSFGLGSSGGSAGGSMVHRPYQQSNHVEAEKVAFERRLLLGDPDWSSRTVADRNTLPRKKGLEFDRGSGSEGIYGKNGHSPVTTPVDSGSRKSDEMFCPACAQHSAAQANNRDSRVSFGSVASSSRGSRGSSSARGGSAAVPIPLRSRSRSHDDDERSSCSRGGGGDVGSGPGVFSTSLPTPPPPPFSSQRDILQQHSALMETINQKISILSSFKPKYHTMAGDQSYRSSRHDHHHHRTSHDQHQHHHHHQQPQQQQHRRSASNVRDDQPLHHSASSLHESGDARRRRSDGASKSGSRSTARKASRRSSGSRTPRAHSGSASSRRSRESVGSSERKSTGNVASGVTRRRSSSERVDDDYDEDRDGGDEESDEVDNNNKPERPPIGTHSASSSSPKEIPQHRESLEKVIARQAVAVAAAAAAAAKISKPQPERLDSKDGLDDEGEDYGTVRRKTRRRSKEDRLSSGGDVDGDVHGSTMQQRAESLRSSQSQTPDDEDSTEARRATCRRHGSTKNRHHRSDSSKHPEEVAQLPKAQQQQQLPQPQPPPPQQQQPQQQQSSTTTTLVSAIAERIPFSLSLRKGGSKPVQQQQLQQQQPQQPMPAPPQRFHHFKHYDHREHPSSSGQCDYLLIDSDKGVTPPSKRDAQCCRPRSASIGNHLSDADVDAVASGSDYHNHSTFPHRRDARSTSRRHHTLDGYCRSGQQPYSGERHDCCDAEEVFLAHGRRMASMTSFHSAGVTSSRSVSSKSEKSSRSSQSPSVENLRHGMFFLLLLLF